MASQNYPETEGFAYTFARGELALCNYGQKRPERAAPSERMPSDPVPG